MASGHLERNAAGWKPLPRQAVALSCPAFEVFYGGAKGGGKALALDTIIPTPTGWTTMGKIRVGDKVLSDQGVSVVVIATTDIMVGRPCYRITFDDGSEIVADAEHRWKTMTLRERAQAGRTTEEFRKNRRITREKRGTGKKPWLAERNRAREYEYLEPATGEIRTTKDIAETFELKGAKNHAVQNCQPLRMETIKIVIDPYVLGLWLGDGTTNNGAITKPDEWLREEVERRGYRVTQWTHGCTWGVAGLKVQLREIGLLGHKHIPVQYLRASYEQRLDLLRGLIDSDGTIGKKGSCEFTSTSWDIASGALELIRTFGIKTTMRVVPAKLNGQIVGTQYRIKFTTMLPISLLPRKAERLPKKISPLPSRRIIIRIENISSVPVRCIHVSSDDGMFLCTESFIPTHNSDYLLGDYISGIEYGSAWRGIIFRRTYPELEELQNRANEIFSVFPGAVYHGQTAHLSRAWEFPGGATLKFRYLASDLDVGAYQGHAYSWMGFDELTEFPSSGPYEFLLSCVRSAEGAPCYVRATGNPGRPGHGWCKARFIDNARPNEIWTEPETGNTRCFIPAKLDDNPYLMKNDPGYARRLMALPEHLRKAFLYGSWDVIVGQVFSEFRRETHVISPTLTGEWYRFASLDWGYAKPFAIGWFAVSPEGRVILYKEFYGCEPGKPNVGLRMGAQEVARKAWSMSQEAGVTVMVADPACWSHNDDVQSIAETFEAAGFEMVKGNNDRVNGLQKVHDMMTATGEDFKPMFMVSENCREWIRTVPLLCADPRNPEDIDTNLEDHHYDATRYSLMSEYVQNPRALRRSNQIPVIKTQRRVYEPLRP